jgi:hypothetical protein
MVTIDMTYLSRVRINPLREKSRVLLASPHAMHGAVMYGVPDAPTDQRTRATEPASADSPSTTSAFNALLHNRVMRSCSAIDNAGMRGRVLVWVGAVIAVAALVGLGIYFSRVGLENADKLASVIGVFVAVAGLGATVYGLIADRQRSGGGVRQLAKADGRGRVNQAGRDINEGPLEHLTATEDDTDASSTASDETHPVQQRATATGNGQVDQAGRDINKR